eukprot:jgi/Mesen1/10018/ME000723S09374
MPELKLCWNMVKASTLVACALVSMVLFHQIGNLGADGIASRNGAAQAANVEGAATEDGRGPSIWDVFSHSPGKVKKGGTGDVADDQYHNYHEDVQRLKALGADSYRFSISWSRVMPKGVGAVNPFGIAYYSNLISALLKAGIKPAVTLYHWDLSQYIQEHYGGWLNASSQCSNRSYCQEGDTFTDAYIVAHNILRSHGKAVAIYRAKYQKQQCGRIGITLDTFYYYPATDSPADIAAAERGITFSFGWFADPIWTGDYSAIMREYINVRLPTFTVEESALIKGSADFFGLNYYTAVWAAEGFGYLPTDNRSLRSDNCVATTRVSDSGDISIPLATSLCDVQRVNFYNNYLTWLARAIREGANVQGYFAWSLLDNFEWTAGFTERFGVFYVNFSDPARPRYLKASALWWKKFFHP